VSLASSLIAPASLEARLGDPTLVVVDVRHDLTQPDTWGESQYRAAHIPGALFAHIERDLSGPKTGRNGRHPLPSVDVAAGVFARYGVDGSKDVVAYDQGGGMYAARLWWMLRWLGHDSVAVLDGGFERWQREQRPVDAKIPSAKPARFEARIGGATLRATDVQRLLGNPAFQLVDARIPERYRGEVEPLDPVPGHIPGAVNRPYGRNLNEDGSFKAPSRLRDEFQALLGGRPVDRMVHYCGSGVTACHNLLAMEVAGLPGAQIYPGSWSEWVADPSHPVAVGEEGAQS
jgi:thiosulfate/3-mercaptopyruvate sulfurtransferase